MPLERKRVWNLWRQMPGNLVPVLITVPILVLAVQEVSRFGLTGKSVWLSIGFLGVGWLAVNYLGLMGNGGLRRAVDLKFKDVYEYDQEERIFVGFSRPGHHGLLDPHEDLGFLVFRDDELEFFGERHQISLAWSMVESVATRPNIHSFLGLGGWIAIDARVGDKAVRMQVEPRVKATHWGNARYRRKLVQRLTKRLEAESGSPA